MRFIFSLLIAASSLLLAGCASDESIENASSRPWNQPRGWEHGLPSGINEGR
jgi:uncharacterized lipoprotein YajG